MRTTESVEVTCAGDVRRIPGQPDMWFFVLYESMVFTAYFCVYLFFRTQHEQVFLHSQSELDSLLASRFERLEDRDVPDSIPVFAGKERWQLWRKLGSDPFSRIAEKGV